MVRAKDPPDRQTSEAPSLVRLFKSKDGTLQADGDAKPPPAWVRDAYASLRETLLSSEPGFPCHFGTVAEERGLLRYTYLEAAELDEPSPLVDALARYLDVDESIPGLSTLIVFAGDNREASLEDHRRTFWEILQYLHDHDPAAWPDEIPRDPDHPRWEFCFAGRPVFVNAHSPRHTERRSRHFSHGLMLVLQNRANFEDLGRDTPEGRRARNRIRERLQEYDDVPPSPDLGYFGQPDNREWRQYWLGDSGQTELDECPLDVGDG